MNSKKILHVTESFGGGVTTAINSYVAHSPDYEHHLFALIRDKDSTGEETLTNFKSVKFVKSKLDFIYKLYRFSEGINADVIHVHSTYAGVLVRCNIFMPARKIVYTPHAFAFLRNDHFLKLKVYWFIERVLAFRTRVIAACGRDEQYIAAKLIDPNKTAELVNVCGELPLNLVKQPSSKPCVVMLGRACEQKGYDFFSDVAINLKDEFNFVWIGGGDEVYEKRLTDAGVKLTGWLSRQDALIALNNADLYFHTAAWDGFPISVIEAANFDLPILLRKIGPFTAEELYVVDSTNQASEAIKSFFNNQATTVLQLTENSRRIKNYHNSKALSDELARLYNSI